MESRLLLLRDGTAIGSFVLRDHATHLLVLEPNAHTYTNISPSGRRTRHLTPTALSGHREMITALLHFRNTYACCASRSSHQLPYICSLSRLQKNRRLHESYDRPTKSASWPVATQYSRRALWNPTKSAFEMTSIDGSAHVQLHASSTMACASYTVDAIDQPARCRVHQIFPVSAAPECFKHPIDILVSARATRDTADDTFGLQEDTYRASRSTATLPSNGAIDTEPLFRPLVTESEGSHSGRILQSISIDDISRWVRTHSGTLDQFISVEVNDGVGYIVVDGSSTSVVMLHSASNGTTSDAVMMPTFVVECQHGGYFRAFDARGYVQQQFTAETFPLELDGVSCDRTLGILTRQYNLIRNAVPRAHHEQSLPQDHDQAQDVCIASTELVEESTTPEARFRAFADGRVRAVFQDRTILQLHQGTCSFTYRDGSTGTCTTDSSSPEQDVYICPARDFAQWAFASPTARFQVHQRKLEQQQRIVRELQRISVRKEMNRSELHTLEHEPYAAPPTTPLSACQRPGEMSQATLAQLLQATQQHMQHVERLLNRSSGT